MNLIEYLPPYLQEYRELKEITQTEQTELNSVWNWIERLEREQFLYSASEYGISRWESMLGIVAKPSESLAFRKERVKNRINMVPPYTENFLFEKLDEVIGAGNWNYIADYENYTFYIESSATTQQWLEEIHITINNVKPCNMVFMNKPYLVKYIAISESLHSYKRYYNYTLGKWRLGKECFARTEELGMIKKGDQMSIQKQLLEELAIEVLNRVHAVRVNDELDIVDFEIRENDQSSVILEYLIPNDALSGESVNRIKLLDKNDEVLSNSMIYVPLVNDMLVKHVIRLREGEGNSEDKK